MGKINWTENASINLESIFNYLAKDSSIFATNFVLYLINSASILENYPKSGRIVPELNRKEIREIIRKNYRIVYQLLNPTNDIEIIAICHSTQDMTNFPL